MSWETNKPKPTECEDIPKLLISLRNLTVLGSRILLMLFYPARHSGYVYTVRDRVGLAGGLATLSCSVGQK